MSSDRIAGIGHIGAAAAEPTGTGATSRATLATLAQEFESMLLVKMLQEMRKAGSWKVEDEEGKEGLGADALFETLDVELASHLAKAQGFGLEKTLLSQFAGERPERPEHIERLDPRERSERLERSEPSERSENSPFGWRQDPFTGGLRYHRGVDLHAVYGEPVAAAAEGRVVFAGEQGSYGSTVLIEHENGIQSRYAHLSEILVGTGDRIVSGQSIGRAGQSGRATGTHVHFEVTVNGRAIDPSMTGLTSLKPERVVADFAVGSPTNHDETIGATHEDRR